MDHSHIHNKEELAAAILEISQMAEIDQAPALDRLKERCKNGYYAQSIGFLRRMVKELTEGPKRIETQEKAKELNAKYFMIQMKGSVRIGHFDYKKMGGHNRRDLVLMSKNDFLTWWQGQMEGEMWLNDPDKVKYNGIYLDPTCQNASNGKLNLWHSYGVNPIAGDVSPFLQFITNQLAQGVNEWANYILNWLAWTIQNPAKRISVVLCFISDREGTGKGTLGNLMLDLFGLHGQSITDAGQLLKDFNAHLVDTCLVFADEAFFAGDRRAADKFKTMITEPYQLMTPKGVDSVQKENNLSFLMATNHSWAATVGWSDRRFAMFEVSDPSPKREYWDTLHHWLNHQNGKEIVLHYLMNRDVSKFHPVDDRPFTPIYIEQRRQSLRDNKKWWGLVLEDESFAPGFTPENGEFLFVNGRADKKMIYRQYTLWHQKTQNRNSNPTGERQFWKDMYAMTVDVITQSRGRNGDDRQRDIIFPMVGSFPDYGLLKQKFEKWLSG